MTVISFYFKYKYGTDIFPVQVTCWLATSSESSGKQQITLDQSVLLKDLEIYTDYAIVVQAFNLAGEGPKSDVKYQKTKEGCEYNDSITLRGMDTLSG